MGRGAEDGEECMWDGEGEGCWGGGGVLRMGRGAGDGEGCICDGVGSSSLVLQDYYCTRELVWYVVPNTQVNSSKCIS